MEIILNSDAIGKSIISLTDGNFSNDQKAEILRQIQEKIPSDLFLRLEQKLLNNDIINSDVLNRIGSKPIGYK